MSDRRDPDLIADISDAAHRMGEYIEGMTFAEFKCDTKTQDAVVRNIEIVGEAVKLLSGELKRNHPDVPWKQMSAMRDVVVHRYFGVALDIVWRVATKDLPDAVALLRDAEVESATDRAGGSGSSPHQR